MLVDFRLEFESETSAFFFFEGEWNEESNEEFLSSFLILEVFLLGEESNFFFDEDSEEDLEAEESILLEDAREVDFLAEAFFRLSPSFKQGSFL